MSLKEYQEKLVSNVRSTKCNYCNCKFYKINKATLPSKMIDCGCVICVYCQENLNTITKFFTCSECKQAMNDNMTLTIKSLALAHTTYNSMINKNNSLTNMEEDVEDGNITLCDLMERNIKLLKIKECRMDEEIESFYGNKAIASGNPFNFKNAISTYDHHIRVKGIRYSDELSEEDSAFFRKFSDYMDTPIAIGGPIKPVADNLYKLVDKTFDEGLKHITNPEVLPERLGKKKRQLNEMNAEHQKLSQN